MRITLIKIYFYIQFSSSSLSFISLLHKIKFSLSNWIINIVSLGLDFSKTSKTFIASSKASLAILHASSLSPFIS